MALTEESFADKIEIVNNHVQVRVATVIKRDGEEISRSFHRHVVAPGDDYSAEDAKVQAVCAAVHTQEVIDAYKAHMEAQANG
jgi:RNA-splicing ligase RtcB